MAWSSRSFDLLCVDLEITTVKADKHVVGDDPVDPTTPCFTRIVETVCRVFVFSGCCG